MTSFIKIKLPRWIGNKSINWSNFKILKNQPCSGSRLNFFTFDEDVGPLLTFMSMSNFWVWNPAPLPTTLPWQVFKPLRASFYFSAKCRYNNGTYFTGLLWSFHEFLKWTFARTSSTEYPPHHHPYTLAGWSTLHQTFFFQWWRVDAHYLSFTVQPKVYVMGLSLACGDGHCTSGPLMLLII